MSDPFVIAKSKIGKLKDIVYPTVGDAFKLYENVVVDYVINKQLYDKGQDGNKKVLKPYKPVTIKIKLAKGQPVDRTTLKDTGRMSRNTYLIIRDDEVEMTTSVPYAQELFEKYGEDVFAVQRELLEEFTRKYILPTLKKSIDDEIAKP